MINDLIDFFELLTHSDLGPTESSTIKSQKRHIQTWSLDVLKEMFY